MVYQKNLACRICLYIDNNWKILIIYQFDKTFYKFEITISITVDVLIYINKFIINKAFCANFKIKTSYKCKSLSMNFKKHFSISLP